MNAVHNNSIVGFSAIGNAAHKKTLNCTDKMEK